jgi:hypothetical protein
MWDEAAMIEKCPNCNSEMELFSSLIDGHYLWCPTCPIRWEDSRLSKNETIESWNEFCRKCK